MPYDGDRVHQAAIAQPLLCNFVGRHHSGRLNTPARRCNGGGQEEKGVLGGA